MRTRLAMLCLATLAACGGGDDSPAPKQLAGTYPLVSADGRSLPAVLYEDATYKLEVTAGTITLVANGSFSDSYTIRETIDGVVQPVEVIPCHGSWTRSGNTVTLSEIVTDVCGDDATATWDGDNTLTVTWAGLGVPIVHRR